MRLLSALLSLPLLLVLTPSRAEEDQLLRSDRPVSGVMELFTSQGCSSCPPADALFKTYAERSDLVAITLPVDYWDYLGWKDTLASPRYTQRQRDYASVRGDGAIYTPQVIVNGVRPAIGSRAREIDGALAATEAAFRGMQVPMRIWHESGAVMIQAADMPAAAEGGEATIWLALVQKQVEVPVQRGENRGRTLRYYNVARELTPVGTWNGKATTLRLVRTSIMRPDIETLAVLMQRGEGGPIIGAAWMGL